MDFDVISPETTDELLEAISKQQNSNFRFGAGYTDLILELKGQEEEDLTVINLDRLNDEQFTAIQRTDDGIRLGSMVTAGQIVADKELQKQYPVLYEAALNLASMQIRQVATIGGNLCTASPAGDMSCALVALEADCEILNAKGELRIVHINDFFTGVRKTVLQKDEVLRSILITSPPMGEMPEGQRGLSSFIKVGTRQSMECSVVSLAHHILLDDNGNITHAGVAIGSSAPTIMFAQSACDFLIGKSFSGITESEKNEFADKIMEYASPISDIRASAWYREEVLHNISKSIFEQDDN